MLRFQDSSSLPTAEGGPTQAPRLHKILDIEDRESGMERMACSFALDVSDNVIGLRYQSLLTSNNESCS